ncbi:MAG: Spo0E like sporulation regulatory protein [Firmicutes bacterium]|nr:Spo0E like sporulation regulatory protein [Bacillota bacterium]
MSDLEDILKSIEELRNKLNKLTDGLKLTDPEVVSSSQMLDALLNEYQKLMKEKINHS